MAPTWTITVSSIGRFLALSTDVPAAAGAPATLVADLSLELFPAAYQTSVDHILVESVDLHLDTVINVAVRRPRLRRRSAAGILQSWAARNTQGTGDSVDYAFGSQVSPPAAGLLSQLALESLPFPLTLLSAAAEFLRVDVDAVVVGDTMPRLAIGGRLVFRP